MADVNWRELAIVVLLAISLLLNVQARKDNGDRISEIQQSRIVAAAENCREENERHQRAQTGILALVANSHRASSATQSAQISKFVQALVPYYDCAARVKSQTRP